MGSTKARMMKYCRKPRHNDPQTTMAIVGHNNKIQKTKNLFPVHSVPETVCTTNRNNQKISFNNDRILTIDNDDTPAQTCVISIRLLQNMMITKIIYSSFRTKTKTYNLTIEVHDNHRGTRYPLLYNAGATSDREGSPTIQWRSQ